VTPHNEWAWALVMLRSGNSALTNRSALIQAYSGHLVFTGVSPWRAGDMASLQTQTAVEILQLVKETMSGDNASDASGDRDSIGGGGADAQAKGARHASATMRCQVAAGQAPMSLAEALCSASQNKRCTATVLIAAYLSDSAASSQKSRRCRLHEVVVDV
jgi:hypothetical protein